MLRKTRPKYKAWEKFVLETMDFFQRQDKARSYTVWLILLFVIGVISVALAIHFVIYGIVVNCSEDAFSHPGDKWFLFALDMAAVSGFILTVSAFKTASLTSCGPDGIAKSLGGVLVVRGSKDPREQRLYNVVEEISIASGVPTPRVFILAREPNINACAIGSSPSNSVICVTSGALDYLTRDELQGVIAHEFSHIANNDVSINTKLTGYLFGLEAIAIVGAFLFRVCFCCPVGASSRSKRDDSGSGAAFIIVLILFLFSASLFIVGSVGALFGNLIRAAISRQREYLADSSAVQFTRNPAGIAGALIKIGCPNLGSETYSSSSVQSSHMFFGSVFARGFLQSLFQSHPPLVKRIKAIDPSFNGVFPKKVERNDWASLAKEEQAFLAPFSAEGGSPNAAVPNTPPMAGFAPNAFSAPSLSLSGAASESRAGLLARATVSGVEPPRAASRRNPIGLPRAEFYNADFGVLSRSTEQVAVPSNKLRIAPAVLETIPAETSVFLVDQNSAKAMFYAILLSDDPIVKQKQLTIVGQAEELAFETSLRRAEVLTQNMGQAARLLASRLATPLIKTLYPSQYGVFRDVLLQLCKADGRLDLFEYTIQASAIRELDVYFRRSREPRVLYTSIESVRKEYATALSYLAYKGALTEGDETRAFQAGADAAGVAISMRPRSDCTLATFSHALNIMVASSSTVKKQILQGFYQCVTSDGVVTEKEAAIVSAITAALGVPAPIWREWDA